MKRIIRTCDQKRGHFNGGDPEKLLCEEDIQADQERTYKVLGPCLSLSLSSLRHLIDYLQIKPTLCQILSPIRSANTSVGYYRGLCISILPLRAKALRLERAWRDNRSKDAPCDWNLMDTW